MNIILDERPASLKIPLEVLGEICRGADSIHDQHIELIDLALNFIRCNPKVRDIVATAVFLAAGPSDQLESLFWFARRCWREAEIEVRKLEQYHGGALPPDHRADFPRPSFARAA